MSTIKTTQSAHPWRATVRTGFQFLSSLCLLVPTLVAGLGLDPASVPFGAAVLGLALGFTRLMALPQVEVFLRNWFPWLAAGGNPTATTDETVEAAVEADTAPDDDAVYGDEFDGDVQYEASDESTDVVGFADEDAYVGKHALL